MKRTKEQLKRFAKILANFYHRPEGIHLWMRQEVYEMDRRQQKKLSKYLKKELAKIEERGE